MLDLGELADDRLERALHVALDDDVELLDAALAHAGEEVIQGDALLRAPRELLRAHALGTQPCEMAGLALVLDDARVLARGRRLVEAEDLDGRAGARFLDLLAAIVVERPHLPPRVAGDDAVPDPEGSARNEHGRDRAAADVQPALDDRAGGLGLRIRRQLELCVGDEEHLLDELVEALLLLGRDVCVLGRPAPLLRLEVVVHELLPYARRVGVGPVDLVHGDDDRHLGGAGVVDGLDRLRHDAVVGGHDEHRDVGHLRAAGAESGERFVSRRVEERDPAAVVVDLVGADVLGDAAGLGLDHCRLADGVEERRLPVVDVPHDRHDRRARDQILGRVLEDLGLGILVVGVLDLDLALELVAISSTASSARDWVMVTISPTSIMILMICGTGMPSAAESSLTVAPELTWTGPVG